MATFSEKQQGRAKAGGKMHALPRSLNELLHEPKQGPCRSLNTQIRCRTSQNRRAGKPRRKASADQAISGTHLTSNTGRQKPAAGREVDAHLAAQHGIRDGQAGDLQGSSGVISAAVPQPEPHPARLLCSNDVGGSSSNLIPHRIGNLCMCTAMIQHWHICTVWVQHYSGAAA